MHMRVETSLVKNWKRFREWMMFSLLLTSLLVLIQALAKIPERSTLFDIKWWPESTTIGSYVFARLLLVCGLSAFLSGIATACGVDGPFTRSKLKSADRQLKEGSTPDSQAVKPPRR